MVGQPECLVLQNPLQDKTTDNWKMARAEANILELEAPRTAQALKIYTVCTKDNGR